MRSMLLLTRGMLNHASSIAHKFFPLYVTIYKLNVSGLICCLHITHIYSSKISFIILYLWLLCIVDTCNNRSMYMNAASFNLISLFLSPFVAGYLYWFWDHLENTWIHWTKKLTCNIGCLLRGNFLSISNTFFFLVLC